MRTSPTLDELGGRDRNRDHPPYVCVVDDDEDIREVITLALEAHGYSIIAAADGADAIRRLREKPGCRLILLDLMMPGMNGWEFRELQLRDASIASIPIVVLSGLRGLSEQAAQLQANAVLQKPVDLERLVSEIARHFDDGLSEH